LDSDWDGWSCTSSEYGTYVTETGTKYKQKKDEYGICRRIPGDSGTATTREHLCCISCSDVYDWDSVDCSGHEGSYVTQTGTVTHYNPSSDCKSCVKGSTSSTSRQHYCDKIYPVDNHHSMSTLHGDGQESLYASAVADGVRMSSCSGDITIDPGGTSAHLNCSIPSGAKKYDVVGSYTLSFSGCGTKYYDSVSVTLYYDECPGGCE
jgi:hypothetical protein